ncbi:nudC domain-containing protein 3 [Nerophis lumbriciformis]|uniref:nudC domain-containing protein 3 n=1 Tax=Nerophis lumbriciformis TaxID=546530 RepID=UPI002ADF65AE|nr:nudC domain-containing protein 3-like [Nerophis lumbriciformis]XP_061782934.1 nudC domain-containing protein 3-like [Nerophis lumbriciformis]
MSSPLEMTEMYDNALLGILQHAGNIQDFLQVYFGFLYRKTDFYRLLSGPGDKMGFPPGVAEKMVVKTYKLFEKMADHNRELQKRQEETRTVPAAVQELEVTSEPQQVSLKEATAAASAAPDPVPETEPQPAGVSTASPLAQADLAAAAASNTAESNQETLKPDSDSYNGAVRENYKWSQDYTDVEVRVFVPKSVVKGRQVSVTLHSNSVRVCMRAGPQEETLMEGEFTHKINTENSLWSLEPGDCVVLSLNKTSEVWWKAVLKGEEEIDVNQINRERSMATVDEDEHAVLDRLTFDYHQKLQGKPQSHEVKVHEMLKKGWDAEGSPFRGQQFDPSMFDIPPSAVQF